MDSSLWSIYTNDTENRTSLTDQNNSLEWNIAPGWIDDYDAVKLYASKWSFDLNNDFEINTTFHYGYTGIRENDEGGLIMALASPEIMVNPPYVAVQNWAWTEESIVNTRDLYQTGGLGYGEHNFDRTSDAGKLSVIYDAVLDKLTLQALECVSGTIMAEWSYEVLKTLGVNQLGIALGGWSAGASLSGADAYLSNFNVVKGTVIPEPISCALFLLGSGTLLAARRLRRKA